MTHGEQTPSERRRDDALLWAGAQIAGQWKELAPEQLRVALRAMEPELKREHRLNVLRLELEREAAQRHHEERQEQRAHRRHMTELVVGAMVALAMLGGGVYVAPGPVVPACVGAAAFTRDAGTSTSTAGVPAGPGHRRGVP
ncbi:hypothetical protein ABZS63_37640, partial [Streptomyces sp. NPDC005568]